MTSRLASIVGFTLLCSALQAQSPKDKPMDYTKDRCAAHDFVIFPWGGMPEINSPNTFWGSAQSMDDVMRDLWECGFNATGFIPVGNVKYAASHGLASIVTDGSLGGDIEPAKAEAAVKKLLAKAPSPANVFAMYLRDEPSANDFTLLGKWSRAIQSAAPGVLPYINLLPNYANDGQLATAGYDEYLERFVKECAPRFLSYDNYSLFEGRGMDADRFYSNIEAMRAASLKHKLPFWNIVLGNCHFQYMEPSQATINLQVYASLAYGARGISYFTYYTPQCGNYRLGAVDQFGNHTPTWNYLRFVNLQIHRIAPVYTKLTSVNVFHHPNVPKGGSALATSRYLSGVTGADLLVGEFEGPQQTPYVMVVNKSLTNSTWFSVAFKQTGKVMLTSPYNGQEQEFAGEQSFLAPGQGMLLHLKK